MRGSLVTGSDVVAFAAWEGIAITTALLVPAGRQFVALTGGAIVFAVARGVYRRTRGSARDRSLPAGDAPMIVALPILLAVVLVLGLIAKAAGADGSLALTFIVLGPILLVASPALDRWWGARRSAPAGGSADATS